MQKIYKEIHEVKTQQTTSSKKESHDDIVDEHGKNAIPQKASASEGKSNITLDKILQSDTLGLKTQLLANVITKRAQTLRSEVKHIGDIL